MQVLDYQSPRTQQPRHPPTFGGRMIKAAAFASIATIIGATMFAWLWIALAIAIWAAILIAHRRRNLKRDHSSIPDGPLRRAWVTILFLGTLLIWIIAWWPWRYDCPHGRTTFVGPFALTFSDCGGPCNNWPNDRDAAIRLSDNWWFFLRQGPSMAIH